MAKLLLSQVSTTPNYINENMLTVSTQGGARGIGLTLAKTAAALGSDITILDVQEPDTSLAQLERDYGSRFVFHR